MKMTIKLPLVLPALLAGILQLHAQGTAFTYQGRLLEGGQAANGFFDLYFSVWTNPSGIAQVGNGITHTATPVSNGLFTVTLDFGAGVFTGASRWLEIAARTNGAPAYTSLSPRQPLTPTPYAILAANVPDYSITSSKLSPGAVGSVQLAAGAVQASNIAAGAITPTQLAKPPRSGSVSSGTLAIDFGQADFTVSFSPTFNTTPVVTLGLQPGYPSSLGEQAVLYIRSQSANGFTGRFSSPATVQKLSAAGTYSSMALVNGTPAICAAGTPASVQYLRATDALGVNWSTPLKLFLDSGGQDYTRLAVVNGNPAIAYHSVTGAVRFVRATDVDGTAWGSPTTVVASSASFAYLSLAVVNGNPAIAYWEWPSWILKYVRATDVNGTAWSAPVTVDSAGSVGRTCSLAVVNGQPAISYEDFSGNALKYIRATDANGAAWGTPVTVDATQGWQTSLVVVNGRPAIGYAQPAGVAGTYFVRADDANGTAWGTPVLVGDYGADLSLQIVNSTPAMSFIANGRLQYARAADADGTAWNSPALLDLEAGAAGSTSLIILPFGVPAISYYGLPSFAEPAGTLRFVRQPQVSFTINWIALEP